MLPSRFNSLAVLNFHKERTDNLDLIDIANLFVCNDNRRRSLFGKFTRTTFRHFLRLNFWMFISNNSHFVLFISNSSHFVLY